MRYQKEEQEYYNKAEFTLTYNYKVRTVPLRTTLKFIRASVYSRVYGDTRWVTPSPDIPILYIHTKANTTSN